MLQSSVDAENNPAARWHGGNEHAEEVSSHTSAARAGNSERHLRAFAFAAGDNGDSDAGSTLWREQPDDFADEVRMLLAIKVSLSEFSLMQVQDWLYTRDAANATVARALTIASSKHARPLPPSSLLPSTAVFRSARIGPSSSKKNLGSALSSKEQPLPTSTRARSSSPSRAIPVSAIDATITSMVAGGASGTTAVQRHLRRNSSRALSATAIAGGGGGGTHNQRASAKPIPQLFSVIL